MDEERRRGVLVYEWTTFRKDPDRIAWMVAEGDAPLHKDGSGPTRLVQDVVPVAGTATQDLGYGFPVQRWENAEFRELDPADAYSMFRREGCGRIKSWRLARRARRRPDYLSPEQKGEE